MAGRISGYLDYLLQLRAEVFEERGKKRSPPVEPTDGLDNAKRQRLGADVPEASPSQLAVSTLPRGRHCTVAQMFTLTNDPFLSNFDARLLRLDVLQQITLPLLRNPQPQQFNQAIDVSPLRTCMKDNTSDWHCTGCSRQMGIPQELHQPDLVACSSCTRYTRCH